MKNSISLITFLVFTILILSVVQVVVSNRLSTAGVLLGRFEDEIKRYKGENALLSERLLTASSFSHIAKVAKQEGFIENSARVVLANPLPIAVKQ